MTRQPFFMDCDTGVDDALALLLAGRLPDWWLVGVSTVAGNVQLCHTFENTRRVLALMGLSDVPVYKGAKAPLLREYVDGAHIHGENGMGGIELPASAAPVETLPAWDALYAAAVAADGELTLVPTGPLTNVAIALAKYPDLAARLKRIVLMGGSSTFGNRTPAAEYNIYADPEAAELVLKSGVQTVLCGLDVTTKAYLTDEELDALAACGSKEARFFRDACVFGKRFAARFGFAGMLLHDPCPVLYLQYPKLFRGKACGVRVETRSALCRGKTVTDLWSDSSFSEQNAFVVTDVDRDAFVRVVTDRMQRPAIRS